MPGIFEFKNHQRQTVEINNQIGAAIIGGVTGAVDGQLVDHQKIVQFRLFKIGRVDVLRFFRTVYLVVKG